MSETTNAERLRTWLRRCPAIEAGRRFGVDWLGDGPGECALFAVPSALRWGENILGRRKLLPEQEQCFVFACRQPYGAEAGQNLNNLGFCRDVANWIAARNAEGDFPEWEGGTVTGVVPAQTAAPVGNGADAARYQLEIRVTYRVNGA